MLPTNTIELLSFIEPCKRAFVKRWILSKALAVTLSNDGFLQSRRGPISIPPHFLSMYCRNVFIIIEGAFSVNPLVVALSQAMVVGHAFIYFLRLEIFSSNLVDGIFTVASERIGSSLRREEISVALWAFQSSEISNFCVPEGVASSTFLDSTMMDSSTVLSLLKTFFISGNVACFRGDMPLQTNVRDQRLAQCFDRISDFVAPGTVSVDIIRVTHDIPPETLDFAGQGSDHRSAAIRRYDGRSSRGQPTVLPSEVVLHVAAPFHTLKPSNALAVPSSFPGRSRTIRSAATPSTETSVLGYPRNSMVRTAGSLAPTHIRNYDIVCCTPPRTPERSPPTSADVSPVDRHAPIRMRLLAPASPPLPSAEPSARMILERREVEKLHSKFVSMLASVHPFRAPVSLNVPILIPSKRLELTGSFVGFDGVHMVLVIGVKKTTITASSEIRIPLQFKSDVRMMSGHLLGEEVVKLLDAAVNSPCKRIDADDINLRLPCASFCIQRFFAKLAPSTKITFSSAGKLSCNVGSGGKDFIKEGELENIILGFNQVVHFRNSVIYTLIDMTELEREAIASPAFMIMFKNIIRPAMVAAERGGPTFDLRNIYSDPVIDNISVLYSCTLRLNTDLESLAAFVTRMAYPFNSKLKPVAAKPGYFTSVLLSDPSGDDFSIDVYSASLLSPGRRHGEKTIIQILSPKSSKYSAVHSRIDGFNFFDADRVIRYWYPIISRFVLDDFVDEDN